MCYSVIRTGKQPEIIKKVWNNANTVAEKIKIVITGGPCAGKTTAMSWIQNAFTNKGYMVLFVDETATEDEPAVDAAMLPPTIAPTFLASSSCEG